MPKFWEPPSRSDTNPKRRLLAESKMNGLEYPQPHVLSSPPGTRAPIHLINYTPKTGEVHAPGVPAPEDELNYSLMPHDSDMGSGADVPQSQPSMGSMDPYLQGALPQQEGMSGMVQPTWVQPGAGADMATGPGMMPGQGSITARYGTQANQRANTFSPGQPPLSPHPYGTGPGPQLQASGAAQRPFQERGTSMGNASTWGQPTGSFGSDPMGGAGQDRMGAGQTRRELPQFTGLDDDKPDATAGDAVKNPAVTPAVQQQQQTQQQLPPNLPAMPGYKAQRVDQPDAQGNPQPNMIIMVPDPPDPSKKPIVLGFFVLGADPVPGTSLPPFQPLDAAARKALEGGGGVDAMRTQVVDRVGPNGETSLSLINLDTGAEILNLGPKPVPPKPPKEEKTPPMEIPGDLKIIGSGPTQIAVRVSADGTSVTEDTEWTARIRKRYDDEQKAARDAATETERIRSGTTRETASIYTTTTDASGQTHILNTNTGESKPIGAADLSKGTMTVGNDVVRLVKGSDGKITTEPVYTAPRNKKVDTINGKTIEYDERDPKGTWREITEDEFYRPKQEQDLAKGAADIEKIYADIETGKISNVEARAKLLDSINKLQHPEPVVYGTGDFYLPPGGNLDVHYESGTKRFGGKKLPASKQAMIDRLNAEMLRLDEGRTGSTQPDPTKRMDGGKWKPETKWTPGATETKPAETKPAEAKPTTEAGASKNPNYSPTDPNWQRADQASGATPAGNALASGPGKTGTVKPGDPGYVGSAATPEQIAAAAGGQEYSLDPAIDAITGLARELTPEEEWAEEEEEGMGAGAAGWDPLIAMTQGQVTDELRNTAVPPEDTGEAVDRAVGDTMARQYPVIGPTGMGLWDPRVGPPAKIAQMLRRPATDPQVHDIARKTVEKEHGKTAPGGFGLPGYQDVFRPPESGPSLDLPSEWASSAPGQYTEDPSLYGSGQDVNGEDRHLGRPFEDLASGQTSRDLQRGAGDIAEKGLDIYGAFNPVRPMNTPRLKTAGLVESMWDAAQGGLVDPKWRQANIRAPEWGAQAVDIVDDAGDVVGRTLRTGTEPSHEGIVNMVMGKMTGEGPPAEKVFGKSAEFARRLMDETLLEDAMKAGIGKEAWMNLPSQGKMPPQIMEMVVKEMMVKAPQALMKTFSAFGPDMIPEYAINAGIDQFLAESGAPDWRSGGGRQGDYAGGRGYGVGQDTGWDPNWRMGAGADFNPFDPSSWEDPDLPRPTRPEPWETEEQFRQAQRDWDRKHGGQEQESDDSDKLWELWHKASDEQPPSRRGGAEREFNDPDALYEQRHNMSDEAMRDFPVSDRYGDPDDFEATPPGPGDDQRIFRKGPDASEGALTPEEYDEHLRRLEAELGSTRYDDMSPADQQRVQDLIRQRNELYPDEDFVGDPGDEDDDDFLTDEQMARMRREALPENPDKPDLGPFRDITNREPGGAPRGPASGEPQDRDDKPYPQLPWDENPTGPDWWEDMPHEPGPERNNAGRVGELPLPKGHTPGPGGIEEILRGLGEHMPQVPGIGKRPDIELPGWVPRIPGGPSINVPGMPQLPQGPTTSRRSNRRVGAGQDERGLSQQDVDSRPPPTPMEHFQRGVDDVQDRFSQQLRIAGRDKEGLRARGESWVSDRLDDTNIRPRMRFNPDVQLDTSMVQDRRLEPQPRVPLPRQLDYSADLGAGQEAVPPVTGTGVQSVMTDLQGLDKRLQEQAKQMGAGQGPEDMLGGAPSGGVPPTPSLGGAMPGAPAGAMPGAQPGMPPQPGWAPPVPESDVAGIGHRFGQPMNEGEPFHSGVDLQAQEGAETISPEDGIIEDVRNDPQGLGLTVIVRDKMGNQHKLGHLKDTRAYRGMVVAKGQNLARVGSTGNTTGSHLHWAVKDQQGQPQDPTPALGAMGGLPPVPGTEMMGPPGGTGSPPGAAAGAPPMGAPPMGAPPMGQPGAAPAGGGGLLDIPPDIETLRAKLGAQPQQPQPQAQGMGNERYGAGQAMGAGGVEIGGEWHDELADPGGGSYESEGDYNAAASEASQGGGQNLNWGGGSNDNDSAGDLGITPAQQGQLDAQNRATEQRAQQARMENEQRTRAADQEHADRLARIDLDWKIHQDDDKRQQEINAETQRHNQAMEQIEYARMETDKEIQRMRDANAITLQQMQNGNAIYLQQGDQAFKDWQQSQKIKMDMLGSALKNPWIQRLSGMTPGPGYNRQAVGGQNISSLISQILQPYDPSAWGAQNAPVSAGLGNPGATAGGGPGAPPQQTPTPFQQNQQYWNQQAGTQMGAQPQTASEQYGWTPSQPNAPAQQTEPGALFNYEQPEPPGMGNERLGAGQGPGTPPLYQQPSWNQWRGWDPFQKAAFRTDVEAIGPGAWEEAGEQMANAFQGEGGNEKVTKMQAAGSGEPGRAGMEMTADVFGKAPKQFWQEQNRQWSQAQAPRVKQNLTGAALSR